MNKETRGECLFAFRSSVICHIAVKVQPQILKGELPQYRQHGKLHEMYSLSSHGTHCHISQNRFSKWEAALLGEQTVLWGGGLRER